MTSHTQLAFAGYCSGYPGLVTTPLVAVVDPPQTACTVSRKPLRVTDPSVLNKMAAWLPAEVNTVRPRCLRERMCAGFSQPSLHLYDERTFMYLRVQRREVRLVGR